MKCHEMFLEIEEAEATLRAADLSAAKLAQCLAGRLRAVSKCGYYSVLQELKRELRDFNMTTCTWKEN